MTRESIEQAYAFVPILYWPVLWLSFLRLRLWLKASGMEACLIRFAVTSRGRIIVRKIIEGRAPDNWDYIRSYMDIPRSWTLWDLDIIARYYWRLCWLGLRRVGAMQVLRTEASAYTFAHLEPG